MKFLKRITGQDCLRRTVLPLLALALILGEATSQQTTLRTRTNVVIIPALVKDPQDEIVYGLQAKDFIIEDDGVEQAVRLDEQPESQPISLVIAIQTGRRASYEFPRMQGLASILEPIVSEGHAKVAVFKFDGQVHPVHDFTSNADRITQDLNDLQPGNGGAAILDAIDSSVKLLEKSPPERQRMLLLISETRDHGSRVAKIDDVVREIGQSNTVVYTLTFSPALSNILDTGRGTNQDEMHSGINFLDLAYRAGQAMRKNIPQTVASMTGGEYQLFATHKKFDTRANDFTNHLHSRYLLSIAPKDPRPGLHQIRVRLREPGKNTVLARTRYWATGTNE